MYAFLKLNINMLNILSDISNIDILIIFQINCFFRYITPEKFYVEPIGTKVLLVVDRVSQQIYTQGN